MINEKNIEKSKIAIKKENKPIIIYSQEDDYNRKISEYGKFDILLSLDSNLRKRTLRSVDSGFNHVLAKIISKNKISLGINLEELRFLENKKKAERLIQIRQNIKISMKNSVKIKLLNYKNRFDAISLMKSLGSSNTLASESLDF